MTKLEDILGEKYADLLGIWKKKKPKDPKKEDYIINSGIFSEDERLKQKCRDLGIDLGEEKKKDEPETFGRIEKKKNKYESLNNLKNSIELFSDYLIKEPSKKIYENYNKNIIENYYKNTKFENKLEKNIYKGYNLSNIISSNFSNIQYSPLGLNLTLGDSASITADNIGEFALPIVEYIHQTQSDYVVASDRGARLLGLAVFRLYNKLYGKFPTADGTLRFRRFSKSNTQEATEKHLQPLVDEMLQYKRKPTVLVLDDWVVSGGTKKSAREAFDRLGKGKIKVKFGVLIGGGADVSGHDSQTSGFAGSTDWRDDSNIIGVEYGKDRWDHVGIKARPVRSQEARNYRRRMYKGIDKLVERIAKEGKKAVTAKD